MISGTSERSDKSLSEADSFETEWLAKYCLPVKARAWITYSATL